MDIANMTSYLTPSGTFIECKEHVKDLGVLMSNDCTFTRHITTIITSAKSTISWVLRTFETRQKLPMLILSMSLILPILEYCSVLWNPAKTGHIQDIEALQWSFVRNTIYLENPQSTQSKCERLYKVIFPHR